jgi:hypothetical protein
VIEERQYGRRVEIREGQVTRRAVPAIAQERQEQTKRVSIRGHRVRTHILLVDQSLTKEVTDQGGKVGSMAR